MSRSRVSEASSGIERERRCRRVALARATSAWVEKEGEEDVEESLSRVFLGDQGEGGRGRRVERERGIRPGQPRRPMSSPGNNPPVGEIVPEGLHVDGRRGSESLRPARQI